MDQTLARELEQYMSNSQSAIRVTEAEALRRGGQTASRYVTLESDEVKFLENGDRHMFFGAAAIEIERAFTRMAINHSIDYFTGYSVTEIPCLYGITFRIDTIVAQ